MQSFFGTSRPIPPALCALLMVTALAAASCKRGGETAETPVKPQPQAAQQTAQPAAPGTPSILMRPIFENERVRALEVAWDPKAAAPAVKQEGKETLGILGVVLKGGTFEYTDAGGAKTRHERKPGDLLWQPGNSRIEARENVGETRINVVQVRLKKAPPTKEYSGPLPGVKPAMNNPAFAAFDYTLAPGSKFPLHKYAPRAWVILEGGAMRSTGKDGKVQFANLAPGQFLWLAGQEQELENIAKTRLRLISIELK